MKLSPQERRALLINTSSSLVRQRLGELENPAPHQRGEAISNSIRDADEYLTALDARLELDEKDVGLKHLNAIAPVG